MTDKLKLACGCDFKPKGDKFDDARRREAKITHCGKCMRKRHPKASQPKVGAFLIQGRMVVAKPTITNWKQVHPGVLGYAALSFRSGSAINWHKSVYVLGGGGDSWFRKTQSPAKGYGLMIRDFVARGKNVNFDGPYQVFKVTVTYATYDFNEGDGLEKESMWLFVHNDFTKEEVLYYILKNKHKWVP